MALPGRAIVSAALAALAASSISARTAHEPRALAASAPVTAAPAPREPRVPKRDGEGPDAEPPAPPLLATLAQTHTEERVLLDRDRPDQARFELLLSDRVTGSRHAIDPRLLGLLRTLAARHASPTLGAPRIEIVSGYRSPKLNEMLRKKGHHVASHSQHSLGHACDFRLVLPGETTAVDPRIVEKEIRALGWEGGVGTYPTKDDWFVHADVGPNRHWVN